MNLPFGVDTIADCYGDCSAWNVGDWIVWADYIEKGGKPYQITRVSDHGYVYWNDPETGEENMTRSTNVMRVNDAYRAKYG